MQYVVLCLVSGILSGGISIGFRLYEIGTEKILVGTQFFTQIFFFVGVSIFFWKYFSDYFLQLLSFQLNWFFIFFVLSSLSYYMVQVLFEWKSRIPLFPTEKEIEEYLEKNM